MSRYCTKCGAAISEDSRFCGKCGAEVKRSGENAPPPNESYSPKSTNTSATARKPVAIKWSSLIVVAILVIWGVRYFGPKIDTSWAVDKACAEVKSEVYNDYGEVPRVSGELIYKDG